MGCCGSSARAFDNKVTQTNDPEQDDNIDRTESNMESKFKQIFIKSANLKLSDKIRVGGISEIYNGKLLLDTSETVDVICKGIKKEIICKYNLFVYILREILIGMCVSNDYAVMYYGLTYNKPLKTIFIIMEKYGSINLAEYICLNSLTPGKKIDIAITTLKIIEQLHCDNIVHRDIKLANFLIKDDHIKICDFGTAIINKTQMNSLCGTMTHMAPEIMTRENYDFTVDYWSYALMLIELFSLTENIDLIAVNNLLVKSTDISYPILAHYIDDQHIIQIIEYIINNYKQKIYIDLKVVYDAFQQIIIGLLNNSTQSIDISDTHSSEFSPITESSSKFASFLEKINMFDINVAERIIYNRSSDLERSILEDSMSPLLKKS